MEKFQGQLSFMLGYILIASPRGGINTIVLGTRLFEASHLIPKPQPL
jgi:hypothetical protein